MNHAYYNEWNRTIIAATQYNINSTLYFLRLCSHVPLMSPFLYHLKMGSMQPYDAVYPSKKIKGAAHRNDDIDGTCKRTVRIYQKSDTSFRFTFTQSKMHLNKHVMFVGVNYAWILTGWTVHRLMRSADVDLMFLVLYLRLFWRSRPNLLVPSVRQLSHLGLTFSHLLSITIHSIIICC